MSSTKRCRGITISVTAETNAGGRRHMEDYLAVNLAPNEEARKGKVSHLREQAYIGVFDGHGGKEAAKCARERLWEVIQKQPMYQSSNLSRVMESVREAFVAMHKEMEPLRETWKRNKMGDLSTAGTTASTVIFRQDHIIVANVGDSTAVLAVTNPRAGQEGQHSVLAKPLTIDHKPEDPSETARIENGGGKVMLSRKGVPRVVWQRERKQPKGDNSPDGAPSQFDTIPFLSVARSLGDFWSYSPSTKEFAVSPCPDVYIHPLNPKEQKFVVVASDGLWNVMTPKQVVEFIHDYENDDQVYHQPKDVVKAVINEALRRWKGKNLLADNIAVLIAFLTEEEYVSNSVSSSPNSCSSPSPVANQNDPTKIEAVTSSSSTSSSRTDDIREDISLSPASSSLDKDDTGVTVPNNVKVEYHTRTKLRHLRKRKSSSSPSTRKMLRNEGVSDNECPDLRRSSLGKRQHKEGDECGELNAIKRNKVDTLDSGLDVDSHTDNDSHTSTEMESHVSTHDKEAPTTEVLSAVKEDSCKVPLTRTEVEEDSSSGVSSGDDNSGPVSLLNPDTDVECVPPKAV